MNTAESGRRASSVQVWSQVWYQVWDQVGDQVGDQTIEVKNEANKQT